MSKEFKINQLFFTNNACYKANKKHTPKGIMWHSTGANNPKLSRYVGPDDGKLGKNPYGNHWNQNKPDGRSVCVHAWIGKLANGEVATYQTLPWDIEGWHCGSGSKGSGNRMGYLSFEICEDGLSDKKYFDKVYEEAINLSVYLCKKYNIPVNSTTIIDHTEGNKMGIASNHGDVKHWFSRFGKTMNDARGDIAKKLKGDVVVGSVFKDVPDDRWSAKDVAKAADLGIIVGDEKGNFNPTDPLTREQGAVIAVRIINHIKGGK